MTNLQNAQQVEKWSLYSKSKNNCCGKSVSNLRSLNAVDEDEDLPTKHKKLKID